MTCPVCKNAFSDRGHYEVASIRPDGSRKGTIKLCSLICIVRWTYDFGARQGAKGALALRGAVNNPEMWKKALGALIDKVMK